ncbi:hypothetical protein FDA09_06265 [Clostridium botulinum]|nr:hypothetical protein [Clostridium botulinum]NFE73293.1 hypothetical protein [Clostridium botulinum]NFH79004.1 hypothetical protein [Clostridium botulinum]NFH82746.1 hypothetical protein [Clostridium botulinum]NFI10995.1 hypothetical protein [Clostridium botulinum]
MNNNSIIIWGKSYNYSKCKCGCRY